MKTRAGQDLYLRAQLHLAGDAGYRISYAVDTLPVKQRMGAGPWAPSPLVKTLSAKLGVAPYVQTNDNGYPEEYDHIMWLPKAEALKFLVDTAKSAIKMVQAAR